MFSYCTSNTGGALYAVSHQYIGIEGSLFSNSMSGGDGGAIYALGGILSIKNFKCSSSKSIGEGGCLALRQPNNGIISLIYFFNFIYFFFYFYFFFLFFFYTFLLLLFIIIFFISTVLLFFIH